MAADVLVRSMSDGDRAVFNSVFDVSSIRRPTQNRSQHGPANIKNLTQEAQRSIGKNLARAVGVGNNDFALSIKSDRHPFKPHFASCSSLKAISEPAAQDRNLFLSNVLRLPVFLKLRSFQSQLGEKAVKEIFAAAVNKVITEFVQWSYSGTYHEEARNHGKFWAKHLLAEFITTFLHVLETGRTDVPALPSPTAEQIKMYQDMTISRLWSLRVDELFDIVVDWEDTAAGVDDIKTLLVTPEARQYVSDRFTRALQTRLLHPGASTIEILQIYISIIRAFRRLDPRGVLLSKVSGRVRQYLREREDTIKVVVAGLLADVSSGASQRTADQMSPDVLSELAWELQNRDSHVGKGTSNLDWNNMNWQPDPVDAAPDRPRSNKQADVIGSVISLFESKEVFVKELQAMLAERLLRNKADYDQETSVIEHLKIRFGDTALQACEVMLRDVTDSRRLDATIRRDQGLDEVQNLRSRRSTAASSSEGVELHAKILSRLFWPSLPGSGSTYGEEENQFKPPLHVLHQRKLYEQGFENLKQTRRITWNDHIGQVEVELAFADGRVYHDEVLPYQAGVLHAFADDSPSPTQEPISKSISTLSTDLNLSPTLIRSACLLFVSKRILTPHPTLPQTYTVLDHLPPSSTTTTTALDPSTAQTTAPVSHRSPGPSPSTTARAAEQAALQAQREAEAREKRAKMAVYSQFVVAMLTNQGPMNAGRILMVLGMVVPGGFGYSLDEVREFLAGMVREGSIEVGNGGVFRKKAAG